MSGLILKIFSKIFRTFIQIVSVVNLKLKDLKKFIENYFEKSNDPLVNFVICLRTFRQ